MSFSVAQVVRAENRPVVAQHVDFAAVALDLLAAVLVAPPADAVEVLEC
jgi:hypothetical protein